MTTLDEQEIQNLLKEKTVDDYLTQYTEQNYEDLLPTNTTYTAGYINIDTQTIQNKFVVLAESYLQIPLRIASSDATPYDQKTELSWKYGIQSIIHSVQVTSGSGVSCVNDRDLALWNYTRNYLEKSRDEFDQTRTELMTDLDKSLLDANTVGRVIPTNDETKNSGLLSRQTSLKQQAVWNAGANAWDVVVSIPLKDIHPFFKAHDFPLINQRYLIQFGLNVANSGNTFQPFTVTGAGSAPSVSVNVAGSPYPGSSTPALTTALLVYKSVKFSPQISKVIVDKMQRGFEKVVDYTVCDVYNGNSGVTTFNNTLITSSVVAPSEVYALFLDTTSQTVATKLLQTVGSLSSCNLLINNSKYYTAQQDFRDHYQRLKGKMQMYTNDFLNGVVSYQDFVDTFKVLYFNVDKIQGRLSSPNAAVSVYLEGQADYSGQTVDQVYMIVRKLKMKMSLANGSGTIVVGASV